MVSAKETKTISISKGVRVSRDVIRPHWNTMSPYIHNESYKIPDVVRAFKIHYHVHASHVKQSELPSCDTNIDKRIRSANKTNFLMVKNKSYSGQQYCREH